MFSASAEIRACENISINTIIGNSPETFSLWEVILRPNGRRKCNLIDWLKENNLNPAR